MDEEDGQGVETEEYACQDPFHQGSSTPNAKKTHTELGDVFPSDKKDLIIVRGVNLGKYWGGPPRNTTQPFSVLLCVLLGSPSMLGGG